MSYFRVIQKIKKNTERNAVIYIDGYRNTYTDSEIDIILYKQMRQNGSILSKMELRMLTRDILK